ncbi:hypothetical protein ACIBCN_14660 [Nocardia sp. NPDC051052]|uniref:hypothetical protein n=1 Tax=Nocardia sp. NPDC051052 TaxID=3364322 RepID=UPI0037AB980C
MTDSPVGAVVHNDDEVNRTVAERFPSDTTVYRLPTGVMLNSIEFNNAYTVKVSGYVWQVIPPGLPDNVTHGVVFPEAEDQMAAAKRATGFTVPYGRVDVFPFTARIRQQFDYRNYPLDHQNVWLRMRSADPSQPVQLVPDFKAIPSHLSKSDEFVGLTRTIVLGDWTPSYTAFSLFHEANEYSGNDSGFQAAELYFNVGIERNITGPLIGRIVPVVLLALLLFLSLFVITTDPDRRTISGFTAFAIIGFSVSTVLVVAVNDNAVRAETGSTGIAYIECWYFALYLMTLLIAVNATLLITGAQRRIVTWHENLLPKLLFWPLFTGVMCASALYVLR